MLGNEWLFETPFGEEVRLRLGSGEEEPPAGRALWEVECVIERLLSNLHDPWRRRGLDHLFEALTGRPPQGLLPGEFPGETIYSPFEPSGDLYERDLNRTFRAAAASGQLRVELIERPRVSVRQDLPAPLGPTAPAPTPTEPTTTWFEVRFVDEVGDPIDGLEVVVRAGGREEKLTTDGDGVARLERADSSFASVRVVSRKALSDIVEPRFAEGRAPRFPELPFTKFPFGGDLPTVSLESEEQKLIVVTPRLGKLFVELWDKTGSERHPHTEYTISGPMSFEGVTDAQGQFLHEDVAPGEYELTLKVDVNRALRPAPAGDGTDEAGAGGAAGAGGGGGGAGAGGAAGAGGGGAGADSDYEPEIEEYETTLVVVDPTVGEPQLRFVGVVPRVHLARMRGMLFDTNKTFILPTALPSLQKIRTLYEQLNPAELLIVGHTDTTSEPSVNDPLSKKRADAMAQYLTDDVDGWLANYEQPVPQKERWGAREDRLMMLKLPGYDARPPEKPPITWYQEQHNTAVDAGAKEGRSKLTVDGKSGPKTRRELITDYMALDGATLSDDEEFHISVQTHGCGENFPLDESLATTDERPEAERDGERDRHGRRVELFFFDHEFAVRPAATAADGAEYLTWRKLAAKHEQDFAVGGINNRATVLPITHAHFRTGSAVLLPEGETPVSGAAVGSGASTSSVCALAMALRFNEERPGHTMLIAGHTDSVGGEAGNQKLSEQRAELVHAVLMGKRDEFAKIAQATHKVSDYKQILKWASVTLSGLEPPEGGASQSGAESPGGAGGPQPAASPGGAELPAHDFAACDPGVIDDVAFTGIEPLKAFQRAYNANKPALGATAADLAVDGSIGPKTWGAIFDCYQFNMAQELGEVDDGADETNPTKLIEGLDKLRGMVTFVALDEEFIGFGEAHPADGNRKDGAASQENRRVELLFFESGQEPDIAILKEAPEITELYSPDAYVRERLPERPEGARNRRRDFRIFLHDEYGQLMANVPYELTVGTDVRTGVSSSEGEVSELRILPELTGTLRWGTRDALGAPRPGETLDDLLRKLGPYDDYRFTHTIQLSPRRPAPAVEAERYLENLGYAGELEDMWRRFQEDYQLEFEDYPSDRVLGELRRVHRTGQERPLVSEDGLSEPPHEEFEQDGPYARTLLIELRDDEGEPVAGQKYEVRNDADELLGEGKLDDQGSAVVLDLPPGETFVSFPAWDESSWFMSEDAEHV